ncbi:MAG: rubrerythrin [Proteobacteria bacterium]|nr:rubrerythrin [Pseudomonadota bacterium]
MFTRDKTQRDFQSLSAREILALAIAAEEEDGRIYRDIASRLRPQFDATARIFEQMAAEEDEHRRLLIDMYRQKFGEHIPLLRRGDVSGFMRFPPVWLNEPLDVAKIWPLAEQIEGQNRRFYQLAAARSEDASIRKLLGDLAAAEASHAHTAQELQASLLTEDVKHAEAQAAHKQFILQIVQPGLAGLMDGSVSTLAPLFAAAFATQSSHATLLVGLAAAVGAGISMGLTEGMSDDGKISGRGSPWVRGPVCGLMTAVGGIGHALPYLLGNVHLATGLAAAVVSVELVAIAWIRWKYMDSAFWQAMVQVVLGGALVVLAGVLLGGG